MTDRIEQSTADGLQQLSAGARTVTAANLQGTVRVITLAEIRSMAEAVARGNAGLGAEEVGRQRAELEAKHVADCNDLHRRIAELESALKAAGESQAAAILAARTQDAARIKELEGILAKDDARLRLAHLEQEVARLQALIDRYEAGLEFITSVERPDIAADLALAEELAAQAGPELRMRLEQLRLGLQVGEKALKESLATINEQHKGTIYGVADLIERSLNLIHWHNELLSIRQALARS